MEEFIEEYYKEETCENLEEVKEKILKRYIKENKIYKFIQFDDDNELNNRKLEALENEELWFSYYRMLNDPTEYEIKYKIKKVMSKTGDSAERIKSLIEHVKELYEVCSFSYEYQDYMWKEYANCGNGICIVFNVVDYDYIYPVVYKEKSKVDFTKMIIESLRNYKRRKKGVLYNDPMALLPWILKNPDNGELGSTKEKEVRSLYCPFDKAECNNGYIYPNVKNRIKYKGINVKYKNTGLELNEIIIGKNCDKKIKTKLEKIIEENYVK